MIISHKYKVIFIHIQKTGGNSVEALFHELDKKIQKRIDVDPQVIKRSKHCFARDVKAVINRDIFDNYVKFCIVRNPFDRMVSWYSMLKYKTGPENSVMQEVNKYASSFEEFLMLPRNHPNGLFERFYVNQLDYISEGSEFLVDRILRFENLTNDFSEFAKEIGIHKKLPHVNKSKREKKYQTYYTRTTREIIFSRFKKDIEYFGYEF